MKILISDKIHDIGVKFLLKNGFKVDVKDSIKREELIKKIKYYDGIIVRSSTKLDSNLLEKASRLKVIGRAGVGLDNIDLKKARELEIEVFNTPEAPSVSVAELTLTLILNLLRWVCKADATMHCGEWNKDKYLGSTLKGKRVGLIGFGNIGQEVGLRLKAMGADVSVFDIDKEKTRKAANQGYSVFESIEDLTKNVEIISLHIPSNKMTRNLIDKEIIDLMTENTIIINTARGDLINEQELLEAINKGKIKGAALDVYREEPLENEELYSCEKNLILTPHIGSQTRETQINASLTIAKKIASYLISLR